MIDIQTVILLLSVISTLVATVASIIAALITSHYALQQKRTELFFNEKTAAYAKVLELACTYPTNGTPDEEAIHAAQLHAAICKAQIVSSSDTDEALAVYALLTMHRVNDRSLLDQWAQATQDAIYAMRRELASLEKLRYRKCKQKK